MKAYYKLVNHANFNCEATIYGDDDFNQSFKAAMVEAQEIAEKKQIDIDIYKSLNDEDYDFVTDVWFDDLDNLDY